MNGTAVERVAKPSAHGRLEVFPAMNRLLTPQGTCVPTATNPGMEPSSELRP